MCDIAYARSTHVNAMPTAASPATANKMCNNLLMGSSTNSRVVSGLEQAVELGGGGIWRPT